MAHIVKLLRAGDVADITGQSVSTVRRDIASGMLPARKRGTGRTSMVLIREDDAAAYVEAILAESVPVKAVGERHAG